MRIFNLHARCIAKARLAKRPAAWLTSLLVFGALTALTNVHLAAQSFQTVLATNLFQPAGVTVSSLNHYIISDTAHHRIVEYNADTKAFSVLAGPDAAPFEAGAADGQRVDARFRNPQGILAVGDSIFVADTGNHIIRQISSSGVVVTVAGDVNAAHQADETGGNPSNFGFVDGPALTASFSAPAGLAYDDANGILYIADSGNKAIRALNLNTKIVSTVTRSGLQSPVAVVRGPNGSLLISDIATHSIKILKAGETKPVLLAGSGSSISQGFRNSSIATNALFSAPAGIYYHEAADELIVADSGNGVLRIIQGVSTAAPKVDTFANTGAAGFQTPIGITRDLYGVYLVTDSSRSVLASVITALLPRIQQPRIGYVEIVFDANTGEPSARLIQVTDTTFDNLVRIAIAGDPNAQHHFTYTSDQGTGVPPLPSANDTTAPNFPDPIIPAPGDDVLDGLSLNQNIHPALAFKVKAFSAPKTGDERISSPAAEAIFRFKCATPQFDSQTVPGALIFKCATTNANIYYTLDGSDPAKGGLTSLGPLKNGQSIPLIISTQPLVVKARAYADRFLTSEAASAEFSPANFTPNRISLGFEDGEASSRMQASPGQRFYAPVTLSLLPRARAYGLQFDVSLQPNPGATVARDYQLGFDSTFVEKLPGDTNRIIPPEMFTLAGTNYVTNLFQSIVTNFTYSFTVTNLNSTAGQSQTNFVVLTNKLQNFVPVVTTTFVTNLNQPFPVTTTNYITNTFQLVGDNSVTNVVVNVDTNYLYTFATLGVTNYIRLTNFVDNTASFVVTNFVENLGQLYPVVTTNVITNGFNLVSAVSSSNSVTTVLTNFTYMASTPTITNFLTRPALLSNSVPIVITNFVSNLGQSFGFATTNYLSNAFNLVSLVVRTNDASTITNFLYEAVTTSETNYLFADRVLPDSIQVVTTNLISNLGEQFTFLTTNIITNAFNLIAANYKTNSSVDVDSTYYYETGIPARTNYVYLTNLLPDRTPIVVTTEVPNMGQQYPVVTTNFVTNAFNLVSVTVTTNIPVTFTTNVLYAAVTPARTNFVVLNEAVPNQAIIFTTNLVSNVGNQYPLITTNVVTNSFNMVSAAVVTNTTTTIDTNFQYRAIIPGTTNTFTLDHFLADKLPVVVTNFISNLGELFPVTNVTYITNSFDLVSATVSTNVVTDTVTNFLYRAVSPPQTNYLNWPSVLPDSVPVVTSREVPNLNQLFTVYSTNYTDNHFDLLSTTVTAATVTNYVYLASITNYYIADFQLPVGATIVTTNTVETPDNIYQLASTNIVGTSAAYVMNITDTNGFPHALYQLQPTLVAPVPLTNAIISMVTYLTKVFPLPPVYTVDTNSPIIPVKLVVSGDTFLLLSSNVTTSISTNVLYRVVWEAATNYVTLTTNLPDVVPMISVGSVTNLGQTFPISITNYATNVFDLISATVVTNQATNVSASVVYELRSPAMTNYLNFPEPLPAFAEVVTNAFVTNLNRIFPIPVTNQVPNTFDLVSVTYNTNTVSTVVTNITYEFHSPALTNYITLSTNLPDSVPVVTTTFINNLGQAFPVAVTNYLTNGFKLISTTIVATTNAPVITTNAVYAVITPATDNIVSLSSPLPPFVQVVTTNFVSNLGQLYPVAVTNILDNTFHLVDTVTTTNRITSVMTNAFYEFHAPIVTNYVTLGAPLPETVTIVTTNFIGNLGQSFPVAVTNYLTNTFRLVSTAMLTNPPVYTTNVLYEFHTSGVTNLVVLATNLPDRLAVVTTNFISNLGQLFPVVTTNFLTNAFTLLSSNVSSSTSVHFETNVVYEIHSPSVTNYLTFDAKLPNSVPIVTTSFITNLGQLFPVNTTNYVTNQFTLLATNYLTSTNTVVDPSFLYSFITAASPGLSLPQIQTNFMTLTNELPPVSQLVVIKDFVTNLNQLFPIYATNFFTNTFKLVSTSYQISSNTIYATNIADVFSSLVITNYTQNFLAVGWVQRNGQTNLYNTKQQDLISFSQPHDNVFLAVQGQAVAGAFSFLVPTNAGVGDTYTLRVARPSATADGVFQDMFIQAPDETNPESKVKAVRTLLVTNQVGYIPGDVSDFKWYNAGEFGDGSILNNDLTELQQSIVYGFNIPPQDSDFLDAMDTCCYTEDGRDLSSMDFANGPAIDINQIAFGDGSRSAPLGNRPYANLQVNDLFVAFRRSLDPTLIWYERYWSNGVRNARIITNTFRGQTTPLSRQSLSANSLPSGPSIQSDQAPALAVSLGTATGMPGQTVSVPIRVHIDGGYPLRTLMFNVHAETADGTIIPNASLSFDSSAALGQPTVFLNSEQGRSGVAWLDTSIPGVLGDAIVGQLAFAIPADAQPTSLYYLKVDRVSGSPNGISLFPVRTGNGLVAMANRPMSAWNDGIPDAWRLQYFASLYDPRSAADVDADGDGLSNYEEFKLGTNPLDANDNLRLHATSNNNRGLKLRFHTAAGRKYIIEGSISLDQGSWSTVQSDVLGTGADIELPSNSTNAHYYYRVRLQE